MSIFFNHCSTDVVKQPFFSSLYSRLDNLSLKQQEDKSEKIQRWEIWIIRIRELKDKCQEKMRDLKSNSEPKNKKDVEEQIIQADVRTSHFYLCDRGDKCLL